VPPPNRLAPIWAPVGLRYHALHHLLPSLPYHSLGEAHRRLMGGAGHGSTYRKANYSGMLLLISKVTRGAIQASRSPSAL
jgi:fatty acid desaturase